MKRKIKDHMTKKAITAKLPGKRSDILRLMVSHNLTGVPIVDDDDMLTGIVTRQDIFNHPDQEQLSLLVQQDPVHIGPGEDISRAAELFSSGPYHHLPVVDDGKLVGILTPADLLICVEQLKLEDRIESIMPQIFVPIFEGTPLKVALEIMTITDSYSLPVLGQNGRMTGLISDRDIFNLSEIERRRTSTELGLSMDEDDWSWDGMRNVMKFFYEISEIKLPDQEVSALMVRKPATIFAGATANQAARIMRMHDYGQLPVLTTDDSLLGMVYELDIIRPLELV